ncbi:hypothetical protein FOR85_12080 [Psychrobacter sp. YGAH215]|uniref:hypothetical protein n=1 Tax=Psychrobacter sp. YGAH215 TaxID=2596826 RepID=UPI0011869518|nr:hypothetical protein [Psychrobacter sp. YGAH215]TSB21767.1 hypothetical protein FOR85_12080 [Psychrobacter sp. YGAH215]
MSFSHKRIAVLIVCILVCIISIERYLLIKNGGCYYGTHDVRVSRLMLIAADNNNVNYCKLLRSAYKDDDSLRTFISLQFYDGASYDHANIVYKLYKYYGSQLFWQKIGKLTKSEKNLVQAYLDYAISEKETFEKYGG